MGYARRFKKSPGELKTATSSIQAAIVEIKEKLKGGDVAQVLSQHAWTCYEKKEYEEAAELLEQAVKSREEALGNEHRRLIPLLNSLGMVYAELKRFDDAANTFVRGLQIAEANPRPSKMREIEVLENFQRMLVKAGRIDEAQQVMVLLESARQSESHIPAAMQLARHLTSTNAIQAIRFTDVDSGMIRAQRAMAPQPGRPFPWPIALVVAILAAVLLWLLFGLK
jgi:tetratricopeptide (TPR) repeat protein